MKALSTRSQFAATVSPMAIGLAMLFSAGVAHAQDTGTPPPAEPPQQTEEEKTEVTPSGQVQEDISAGGTTSASGDSQDIVVTGFRASLMSAINKKKTSEQVVESVSAEDIGKLPDASIGESIARLPGLTSQRLNGRAAFISIRGFGPDFSTTLLNGREQTSTGDNRAVEFDQYPSEVVNRVDVYKTMTPSIIGQGLVGTVDIRTARPLETSGRVMAIGLKASNAAIGKLNSGSKEYGWRGNATFIDKFSDDTMGIALSASYVDEPYQIEEYNAWGWGNKGEVGGNRIIAGNKSFVTSTQLKRYGGSATFQADLSNAFRLTVDGFYSKFDDDIIKRGIELPLGDAFGWTAAGIDNPTIEDGNVVAGTFHDIEAVVNNHHLTREADLISAGANLAWRPGNGWKGELDISISRTDREELIFESNSGTGRGPGVGARDTLAFNCDAEGCSFDPTIDYSDPDIIQLTSPMGWGGISGGQDGYYNNRIVDDELKQYRGDVERELVGFLSSVRAGLSYTDRDKSLTPDESFVVLADGSSQMRVPDQYLVTPTDLSYLGLGPVISYDPIDLLNGGIYELVPNPSADIPKKAFDVRENLYAGYVMANLDHDIGVSRLTGNFGVQAVRTHQESTGAFVSGNLLTRGTEGATYWDVLPSMNLSFRTPADLVVRVGLARQMQRPRLDDMRRAFSYGLDTSSGTPLIKGDGGNPKLRPYRANAADFTVEKYFGNRGYLAAQLFYKQLKNFIYEQEIAFDFAGLPLPEAPNGIIPPGTPGLLKQWVNAKGGKIYGFELAGTLPFGEFVPALDGFGITGGYGYTKSRVRPSPGEDYGDIPGYSRHVANGTLFFEKWGFGARVSARYRSTFRGEFSGFGANRERRRAGGETVVDAQIGYDFGNQGMFQGASLFLQASNITDEPMSTTTTEGLPEVIDYQTYGRRYQAGITYKF